MNGPVVYHPMELQPKAPIRARSDEAEIYHGGAVEIIRDTPAEKLGSFATIVGLENQTAVS